MRVLGCLLSVCFFIVTEAAGQQKWFVRAEGGPLLSVSYTAKSRYIQSESDLQHQYGVSGGTRLGNSYFSLESGLYRQEHSTITRLSGSGLPEGQQDILLRDQYNIYKVPLRVTADLLPVHSKIGFQFLGGMSYMFTPGRKPVGGLVPTSVRQVQLAGEEGSQITISNKYFLDGAWGIELGLRGSYRITDNLAAEATGMFQAGLRHMATARVYYTDSPSDRPFAESYSRAEAVSVLLSLRYEFGH